jgi:molybdopterin synthase catalytic subunit
MDSQRWIKEEQLELDELLDETRDDRCGALQVFGGTVRRTNDGREVDGMTYEAHVALAARTLRELEETVKTKFNVPQCRIQHRVGELQLGEVSVYVVVRSPHRAESFEAARYAIDKLKEITPIWKHEHYVSGDSEYLSGTPLRRPDQQTD